MLAQRFADYLGEELERAPRTIEQYVLRIRLAQRWLGTTIESVATDPDGLRRLKKEMRAAGYSSSHIKGILVAVHQLHLWGALEGLWPQNGVVLVRAPRERNVSPPPLSLVKTQELLAACAAPLEFRLVYFGFYLGTRIGESAIIDREHEEDGWLDFRGEKNGRKREVPVHPRLAEILPLIFSRPPPYRTTLDKVKKRLQERVGFDFKSHQFRITFSTSLYDADVGGRVVKELLGHTPDVTGRYIVISRRKKLEAIPCLPY